MTKENARSSLSQAASYEAMGEFWDSHDAGEVWDQTQPVDFEVDLKGEKFFFPWRRPLANKVSELARAQGVSAETLLNLWVQEKILQIG